MLKKRIHFIILSILSLAFLVMVFQWKKESQNPPLPILGKVSDFSLYNSNAKEFSLANLNNKIWIADFIFTTCAGICPVMTKNMASLHRSFLLEDLVELVSISVNPEYDSPQVMAEYAKTYKANTKKWHFLTGSRETIKDLAVNSFKIGSVEEPVFHSAYFVLVDRQHQVRGYYEGTQEKEIKRLLKDVASLLKEGKRG